MSKTVCGISFDGSCAIVVTLNGTKGDHSIARSFTKINIKDHNNQAEIHSFKQAILNHFDNESVSVVGIKGRATKGQYSGGPISFKLEGVIQTIDIRVVIVHPATIKAALKKCPVDITPKNLFKYQHEAYKVAYYLLED